MTKQQMIDRKEIINKQVTLLKMIYDKVEVVDYKSGLIECRMNNQATIKLYKENEELYSNLNIGYISENKYFLVLRIYDKKAENQIKFNSKIKYSIILNKRTLEEIFRFEGALVFTDVICNGKYVIAKQTVGNNVYLFDINNNKIVLSSDNSVEGLLEKVIDLLGKGVFK